MNDNSIGLPQAIPNADDIAAVAGDPSDFAIDAEEEDAGFGIPVQPRSLPQLPGPIPNPPTVFAPADTINIMQATDAAWRNALRQMLNAPPGNYTSPNGLIADALHGADALLQACVMHALNNDELPRRGHEEEMHGYGLKRKRRRNGAAGRIENLHTALHAIRQARAVTAQQHIDTSAGVGDLSDADAETAGTYGIKAMAPFLDPIVQMMKDQGAGMKQKNVASLVEARKLLIAEGLIEEAEAAHRQIRAILGLPNAAEGAT